MNAETAWADRLVDRVVPWSRYYGVSRAAALGNCHRFEILTGMAGLSVYSDDLISRGGRPIQTPFGQTVLLREDNAGRRLSPWAMLDAPCNGNDE